MVRRRANAFAFWSVVRVFTSGDNANAVLTIDCCTASLATLVVLAGARELRT